MSAQRSSEKEQSGHNSPTASPELKEASSSIHSGFSARREMSRGVGDNCGAVVTRGSEADPLRKVPGLCRGLPECARHKGWLGLVLAVMLGLSGVLSSPLSVLLVHGENKLKREKKKRNKGWKVAL